MIHLDACAAGALAPPTPVVAAAVEAAGKAHGLDLAALAALV